jgi:hypothetical protein
MRPFVVVIAGYRQQGYEACQVVLSDASYPSLARLGYKKDWYYYQPKEPLHLLRIIGPEQQG